MAEDSLSREIERDINQLKQDFRSHHWLLAVSVIVLFFGATTAWRLSDIAGALTTSVAIFEKLNNDNNQLKQQLAAVRQELADLRQGAGAGNPSPQPPAPVDAQKPGAPSTPAQRQSIHPTTQRHR
jgi:cell division protein FtsB